MTLGGSCADALARRLLRLRIPAEWPARCPIPAAAQITIGRSPDSDIQIDLPIVSWNHAVITEENGKYILEDRNSRNGTAIGELSNRIQRAVLEPSDEVYLGSYKISAAQLLDLETKVEIGEAAFQTVSFRGETMEVGRDPKCDIPLDFPMVSWRHARLTRTPEGILVEDLGSRNGTYLDGVRVTGRVLAKAGPGDRPGQRPLPAAGKRRTGAARLQRQGHHRGQGHRGQRAQRQAPAGRRLAHRLSL